MPSLLVSPSHTSGFVAIARCHGRARRATVECRADAKFEDPSRRAMLLAGSAAVLPAISLIHGQPAVAMDSSAPTSAYDFVLEQYGKPFPLSYLRNKVTVFVNVASE